MLWYLWWKTQPPSLLGREINVEICYVPESQLCFLWLGKQAQPSCAGAGRRWQRWQQHPHPWEKDKHCEPLSSSENIFIAPVTAIGDQWELRMCPRHSSFPLIFTHFQSHYKFLLVTLLGKKRGKSSARCFLDTPSNTGHESTGQIKVYLWLNGLPSKL